MWAGADVEGSNTIRPCTLALSSSFRRPPRASQTGDRGWSNAERGHTIGHAALKTDCERILTRLDARIDSDKATRAANAKARLNGVLLTFASSMVLLALLFLLLCQVQVRVEPRCSACRLLRCEGVPGLGCSTPHHHHARGCHLSPHVA